MGIHSVIEHMKEFHKDQVASIAAEEAKARERAQKKNIEITKHRDLCVLKFPDDGTRLLVRRWSHGAYVLPPRRKHAAGKSCMNALDHKECKCPDEVQPEPEPEKK